VTKFLSLLKVFWKQNSQLSKGDNSKQAKRKRNNAIAVYIILGVTLLPIAAVIAVATYGLGLATPLERAPSVLSLLILATQGFVLLFGVPGLISHIFNAKDGERLLPLPVATPVLFSAKLAIVYIDELISAAIGVAVLVIPYGIGAGLGIAFWLALPILLLFIPMLPLIVACIICFPLSWLLRKVGNNGIAKSILQLALFVAVMAGYMMLLQGLANMTTMVLPDGSEVEIDQTQAILNMLSQITANISPILLYIWPVSLFAKALSATSFLPFVGNLFGGIGINAVLFGIVVLIAIPTYRKTMSQGLETSSKKREKIAIVAKKKGVLQLLMTTDIKRVIRDGQLGFQMLMGIIMLPLLSIVFSISFGMSGGEEAAMIFDSPIYQIIAPVAIFAYFLLLIGSSNMLGTYPITRERQGFFILKTLPITVEKILQAKVVLASLFVLVSNVLGLVSFVIFLHIKWYYALVVMVATSLIEYGIMCITTLLDLKSPNITWTNFNNNIKNAKNSLWGMLVGLIVMAVVAAVAVPMLILYFPQQNILFVILMWALIIGIAIVFALVTRKIMNERGKKYFEEIE
jgi:ABC-2 type transport system permease protein